MASSMQLKLLLHLKTKSYPHLVLIPEIWRSEDVGDLVRQSGREDLGHLHLPLDASLLQLNERSLQLK